MADASSATAPSQPAAEAPAPGAATPAVSTGAPGAGGPGAVLNINVGVLGHVDSGKTSLVRALSTQLSTAALDKHPQSQERGITLDLGFSAFLTDIPPRLNAEAGGHYSKLQFTLVDCPGHAALIRTIIGGAQIIDMMLLVIDVTKGIQTQTAECLVIAEIMCRNLIIVLNKVDMFPPAERQAKLEKAIAKVKAGLAGTSFADAIMVPVSAAACGGVVKRTAEEAAAGAAEAKIDAVSDASLAESVPLLVRTVLDTIKIPKRHADGPFLFSVDHCFKLTGKGTVFTGTVLSGSVRVGQTIEIPALNEQRKVKSMQMFHRPIDQAVQGDRLGICVVNFDSTHFERGILASPGSVPTVSFALALVRRVKWYRNTCTSGAKFHISVGHSTVIGKPTFFGAVELADPALWKRLSGPPSATGSGAAGGAASSGGASGSADESKAEAGSVLSSSATDQIPKLWFDWQTEYLVQDELKVPAKKGEEPATPVSIWQWAVIRLETPIICPPHSMIVGSRLDVEEGAQCRLAFYGRLIEPLASEEACKLVRMYKTKERTGVIEKVSGDDVIGKGMFKKGADLSSFVGLKVTNVNGQVGEIRGAFGKGGKYKVYFSGGCTAAAGTTLTLKFKRFVHDEDKDMVQE